MKRFKNIEYKNKEQLKEIEYLGEQKLNLFNERVKKQINAINEQKKKLKEIKYKKTAIKKSWKEEKSGTVLLKDKIYDEDGIL